MTDNIKGPFTDEVEADGDAGSIIIQPANDTLAVETPKTPAP